MKVDHIFIFSDNLGQEAQDLIDFGFQEGSNRVHKGQGTSNRKFYFENFFLEILWVHNENELTSSPTKATRLWERANFRYNGNSRYGLCLINSESTDELFKTSQLYQPNYFPPDMSIDILPHIDTPQLPWTFRLPYRGGKKVINEPTTHLNQIHRLTKVNFGIKKSTTETNFTDHFKKIPTINFIEDNLVTLTLEFDNHKQRKTFKIDKLDLIIKY